MRDGYQISDNELKQIQDIQIELISEVDRICKKYNIKYNMVGGTMLGAIRHKGHIPWDDDADIGFLRKEYERFRKACTKELDGSRFYIQDFRDTSGYRWGYGKLRRKGTKFTRLGQEEMPYPQGVFIDLMPFDPVPDNPIHRRIHFLQCFIFRKAFWSKIGKDQESNLVYRYIYKLINHIPEETIKKQYRRFIFRNAKKKTKLVRILTFPTPRKCYGYDRRWYEDLSRYQFNSLSLPGARDYDGYLHVKYGNYMELPPENKRKVHPVSELKLLEEDGNK